jgi:hypothetical protein
MSRGAPLFVFVSDFPLQSSTALTRRQILTRAIFALESRVNHPTRHIIGKRIELSLLAFDCSTVAPLLIDSENLFSHQNLEARRITRKKNFFFRLFFLLVELFSLLLSFSFYYRLLWFIEIPFTVQSSR